MALSTNLVAFWKLGEASGTRLDAIGSNNLVDNNTVTQAAGRVGNAAQFTFANSEFLSIADNADMSTGDIDFTFACWVYLDSVPVGIVDMIVASKWTSSGDQREWGLTLDEGDNRFNWFVNPTGGSSGSVTLDATSFGDVPLATWIFIVLWHDSVNDTLNIQINNGAIDTVAYSAGVFDGTSSFKLGQINGAGFWDGRIDAVGWWKKVLNQLERTRQYNDGLGLEPPFPTSTYTEPETVVVQVCDSDTGFSKEMILPRFAGEEDDPNSITKFLDEQAEIIEDKYNSQVAREAPCEICVTTGSIVLDCGKCVHFEVAADADINSISFINCVAGDELDILFRASKDVNISGWPSDFTCPTCGTASSPTAISSGNVFRRRLTFGGGGSPIERDVEDVEEKGSVGGGGGGAAQTGLCPCTPDDGDLLTVAICTEMDCDDTEPKIELTACGGTAPYTWTITGGETPTQTDSGIGGLNTKIEPPTNTTPGTSGDAFSRGHSETLLDHDLVCRTAWTFGALYNCAGVKTGNCVQRTTSAIGDMPVTCESASHAPHLACAGSSFPSQCGFTCREDGGCDPCEQRTVDLRTAQMITDGCKPCSATMEGMIVTVTDAVGAVVSTVVRT